MSCLLPFAATLGVLLSPPLEVTVSVGGALAHSTDYEHRYVPRVEFDATPGGSAHQRLRIDPGQGLVLLQLALGARLGARYSLEVSVLASRWSVEGTSGPHAYRLVYTSRLPPSNEPALQTVDREQPWPDPEGAFRNMVLAAGLRRRFQVAEGTGVSLFAGPSLHRVGGDFGTLAWLSARLGGHSVLFADEHALEVDMEPRWTAGVAAGAAIDARVSPHLAVVLTARYHRASRVALQPRVVAVANADQVLSGLDTAAIARRFTPEPLQFQASFLQASIGIRLSR